MSERMLTRRPRARLVRFLASVFIAIFVDRDRDRSRTAPAWAVTPLTGDRERRVDSLDFAAAPAFMHDIRGQQVLHHAYSIQEMTAWCARAHWVSASMRLGALGRSYPTPHIA